MDIKAYALVNFMTYLMNDRHDAGKKHCCQDYAAIINIGDSYNVYEFDDIESATAFQSASHMKDVMVAEDCSGVIASALEQHRRIRQQMDQDSAALRSIEATLGDCFQSICGRMPAEFR